MVPKASNYYIEIVCLANSRKMSGRCIAGKIVSGPDKGKWVRPVSNRLHAEISEDERSFEDGTFPRLMDCLNIPFKCKAAHAFQIENHEIDDGYYWSKSGRLEAHEIAGLIDHFRGPLWENRSSSYYGVNDRVEEHRAPQITGPFGSLKLIRVKDLKISVSVEGAEFNNAKRKVRGSFSYDKIQYAMTITDPLIVTKYLAQTDGFHDVGAATICISLGDTFNGFAYKLIAAILPAVV